MVSRKITKVLVTFLRREVKAKKAEWGELYKLKSLTSVRKGLPNIPRLTILSEPWLSYIIAIKSGSEVRLYYYNNLGILQHGDTFLKEETQILEQIQKKSRRLHRYPPKKKELTIVDITKHHDSQFFDLWNQITRHLKIPKKRRRNRPVIKIVTENHSGIFNTKTKGNFIYIHLNTQNLLHVYTYYSLYFLLPSPIRNNSVIAENLALRLYDSYKKTDSILPQVTFTGKKTIDSIEEWKKYSSQEILTFLNRLCMYNTEKWECSDFLALRNISQTVFPEISRNNIHQIFCQISKETGNSSLSLLAAVMAFSFGKECKTFHPDETEVSQIYSWIKQGRIKRILNFLRKNHTIVSQGLRKAIMEALQYWYANILEISSDSKTPYEYRIKNKSDLTIVLDNAKLISPSKSNTIITYQKQVILPYSEIILSFSSYTKEFDCIISLNYYLIENEANIGTSVFTGKINLL
ncbi:MAG: hypothetical protein KAT16_05075 [Candidatus Heimdallarchaeota archaeon]|nr:hypothetical protein [Candidatus Heimdallarchaeota archaeon]